MSFFLSPPTATPSEQVSYDVHPLAIFGILDHHRRRDRRQQRVDGALLGEVVRDSSGGSVLRVQDCFPIRYIQGRDSIDIYVDEFKKMVELQGKLNSRQSVVGWYSTGGQHNYASTLLDRFVSEHVNSSGKAEVKPIHLLVDTELKGDRLGVKAFTGRTVNAQGREAMHYFAQVNFTYAATFQEKIALEAVRDAEPEDRKKLSSPSALLTEFESLEQDMSQLQSLLAEVSSYVDKVVEGKAKGSKRIGEAIKNALAAVPSSDPATFAKGFQQKTQDLLMLMYLSSITKYQAALGNRIYEVLE